MIKGVSSIQHSSTNCFYVHFILYKVEINVIEPLFIHFSYNPDYGLGYQWEPADLTIMAGESVVWSWTGSPFTPVKRLVQVIMVIMSN